MMRVMCVFGYVDDDGLASHLTIDCLPHGVVSCKYKAPGLLMFKRDPDWLRFELGRKRRKSPRILAYFIEPRTLPDFCRIQSGTVVHSGANRNRPRRQINYKIKWLRPVSHFQHVRRITSQELLLSSVGGRHAISATWWPCHIRNMSLSSSPTTLKVPR